MTGPLRSVALNCSLKRGEGTSSTDRLLGDVNRALTRLGVETTAPIRVANHVIRPGVRSDEGDGDEWPALCRRILESNILVFGTPIWLGHPSSIAQLVLERMDAFLGELDDEGRMFSYGKVAIIAVVGNEDGAHHVVAQLAQGLNDVGFSFAASASTYWVGEAMGKIDYADLDETPEAVAVSTLAAATNATHLARLLVDAEFPPSLG